MYGATGPRNSIFPRFPNMLPMQPLFGNRLSHALQTRQRDAVAFGNRFTPAINYNMFGLSQEGVARFEAAERDWREQMHGMVPDRVGELSKRIRKLSDLTLITFSLNMLERDKLKTKLRRYTKILPRRIEAPVNERLDHLIGRLITGKEGKVDFGGGVIPLGRHNLMLVNKKFSAMRGFDTMTPQEKTLNRFLVLAHESVHAHHARYRLLPVNIGNRKDRASMDSARKMDTLYKVVNAFAAEQMDISGLYSRAAKVIYHEKPETLAAIKPMLVTEAVAYQLEAEVAEKFSSGDPEFDEQNVAYLRAMSNGFMEVLTVLNDVLLP